MTRNLSVWNSLKPFSVGFDSIFDEFDRMLDSTDRYNSNYPPYNIHKLSDNDYKIEVALAKICLSVLNICLKFLPNFSLRIFSASPIVLNSLGPNVPRPNLFLKLNALVLVNLFPLVVK